MTGRSVTESAFEEAALAWLEAGGWQIAHGADIAPDMPTAAPHECHEGALADVHIPKLREACR